MKTNIAANAANSPFLRFAPFAHSYNSCLNYRMNTVTSFPPIISPNARVLILGSMPGIRSLELNQYYGHPRNLFWTFMGGICGAAPDLEYAHRVEILQQSGIALWDVLQHCERSGSLDAAIVTSSEIPNDIPGLLNQITGIQAIAFNGRKAEQAFRKHVLPNLTTDQLETFVFLSLPSTSPANASIPKPEKQKHWLAIGKYL
jgi:hypoxanthine-DNA glycosylase